MTRRERQRLRRIDWQSELMVFTIWPVNSNDVRFEAWQTPLDGTGVFSFTWDSIEPAYSEHYPAVLHTVSREGLEHVDFMLGVSPGVGAPLSLAVVPVPEPSGLALMLCAVVSSGWIMRKNSAPQRSS